LSEGLPPEEKLNLLKKANYQKKLVERWGKRIKEKGSKRHRLRLMERKKRRTFLFFSFRYFDLFLKTALLFLPLA
jgi:hypothetical protein